MDQSSNNSIYASFLTNSEPDTQAQIPENPEYFLKIINCILIVVWRRLKEFLYCFQTTNTGSLLPKQLFVFNLASPGNSHFFFLLQQGGSGHLCILSLSYLFSLSLVYTAIPGVARYGAAMVYFSHYCDKIPRTGNLRM